MPDPGNRKRKKKTFVNVSSAVIPLLLKYQGTGKVRSLIEARGSAPDRFLILTLHGNGAVWALMPIFILTRKTGTVLPVPWFGVW